MRRHRSATEHQEAVSRRLALLSAELTAVREEEGAPNEWAAPATHTRVAPGRLGDDAVRARPTPTRVRAEPLTEPESGPFASPVPVPGRHARRRPGPLGRGLPGLVAIGPGQLAVVVLVVVAGLAATAWWLIRASPTEVPAADAVQEPAPLLTGLPTDAGPTAGGEDQAAELVVDVAGKVRRPGIAVLAPGSRVVDALEAAGGARAGVDLSGLNLARQLVDGEQILVGVTPAPGVAAEAAGSPAPAGGTWPLVPLNTASQTELEALPEVGPVTASAIIAWREEHGGFTAVDELLEVDGIGDATLAQLAPLVTL